MHSLARPKIATGVDGVEFGVTVSVADEELPQLLLAVTEIVPPFVPAMQ